MTIEAKAPPPAEEKNELEQALDALEGVGVRLPRQYVTAESFFGLLVTSCLTLKKMNDQKTQRPLTAEELKEAHVAAGGGAVNMSLDAARQRRLKHRPYVPPAKTDQEKVQAFFDSLPGA